MIFLPALRPCMSNRQQTSKNNNDGLNIGPGWALNSAPGDRRLWTVGFGQLLLREPERFRATGTKSAISLCNGGLFISKTSSFFGARSLSLLSKLGAFGKTHTDTPGLA